MGNLAAFCLGMCVYVTLMEGVSSVSLKYLEKTMLLHDLLTCWGGAAAPLSQVSVSKRVQVH